MITYNDSAMVRINTFIVSERGTTPIVTVIKTDSLFHYNFYSHDKTDTEDIYSLNSIM